jgi:hypothetical protein
LACTGGQWNFNAELATENDPGFCTTCAFAALTGTCSPFHVTGTFGATGGQCCCEGASYTVSITVTG